MSIVPMSGLVEEEGDDLEEVDAVVKPTSAASNEDDGLWSEKPKVFVPGDETTISHASEALFSVIGPKRRLFWRGGQVVEIVEDGGVHINPLDAVAAQSRFEEFVSFQKMIGVFKGSKPTNITEQAAKQYLKSAACKKHLPRLTGLLRCPLLVEKDGGLHWVENGYDETTGYYVVVGKTPVEVHWRDGVQYLKKIVKDFDFVSPGDRSRALASFLTPALKLGGLIKEPIPYRGAVDVDPSKFIVMISSNGFEATKDLANRSSIIRIRKRDGFAYEPWCGMDLLEFIRASF